MIQESLPHHGFCFELISSLKISIVEGIDTDWSVIWQLLVLVGIEFGEKSILSCFQGHFVGAIRPVVTQYASNQLITVVWYIFHKENSLSSEHWLVDFLSPDTALVQFNPIVAILEDSQGPMSPSLGRRLELLVNIIALLFQVTNVSLHKVLTVISKANKKDAIIINRWPLQKIPFDLPINHFLPKLHIFLTPFSLPLCVSPWVSYFQHFYSFTLIGFKLCCIDLHLFIYLRECKHDLGLNVVLPSLYRHCHLCRCNMDGLVWHCGGLFSRVIRFILDCYQYRLFQLGSTWLLGISRKESQLL